MTNPMDWDARHPLHTKCMWRHDPQSRCPTPLEMHRLSAAQYARESEQAQRQGISQDDFDAGWERRLSL